MSVGTANQFPASDHSFPVRISDSWLAGGQTLQERPLSASEQKELSAHVRNSIRAKEWLILLAMTAWAGLAGHALYRGDRQYTFLAVFVLCVCAFSWVVMFIRIARRKRLTEDLASGMVILLDLTRVEDQDVRQGAWEVLPCSKVIWSQDGKPAGWRRVPQ